jgi:hypothetical protein
VSAALKLAASALALLRAAKARGRELRLERVAARAFASPRRRLSRG